MESLKMAVSSERTHTGSPESSLSWCLSQLQRVEISPKVTAGPRQGGEQKGKEDAKKVRAGLWRALVAIRTRHTKRGESITHYRVRGGLPPLLKLLQRPLCDRKTLDLALSILANCCTENESRVEVRKLGGIPVVVEILKNILVETVQNRAARALGNLAVDPENSGLIHAAGGVPPLILCLTISSATSASPTRLLLSATPEMERAQSAARALRYLSDTPSNRLSLLSRGALPALALLIAPEYSPCLRRASLRALHELTRGCSVDCAREVVRSDVLAHLGALALGEDDRLLAEISLKILANLCSQGSLRPLVGSLGAIPKFVEEARGDAPKCGPFFRALCLCCREAVNRVKVKESGGLEVLIDSLAANQSHPFARLATFAFVDFVYDESALEQLLALGLVPLLVAQLVALAKGEDSTPEEMEMSVAASSHDLMSTCCFDSFDFPPLETSRKEDGTKEQESSSFLSLRSWLLSEGLISCEGELLSPTGSGTVGAELGSCPLTPDGLFFHSSPSPSLTPPSSLPLSFAPAQKSPCESPSNLSPASTSTPKSHLRLAPPSPSKAKKGAGTSALTIPVALTSETPPTALRPPTYRHPYHPEAWTAESPILLLLSRFSQSEDPSSVLVNAGAISGLLCYLTQRREPSSRCFRLLYRLSCNPNCLEGLVKSGCVALVWQRLCLRQEEDDRQTAHVKARVCELGKTVLNNLRVHSESSFGAGVLTHIMLSGSDSDRLHCALSLPLINRNKLLLKKLLLDNGGLQLALQALDCHGDDSNELILGLSSWLQPPQPASSPHLWLLYFSLLTECLSNLSGHPTLKLKQEASSEPSAGHALPPFMKQLLGPACPYVDSSFDLVFLLDDNTKVPANMGVVAGDRGNGAGSDYFRGLLRGGFWEGRLSPGQGIPIRNISSPMLLPVMHYLHGCSVNGGTREEMEEVGNENKKNHGRCRILGSLHAEGLWGSKGGAVFQITPLMEAMKGANMFLVSGLQRELEDLSVSLLLSSAAFQSRSTAMPGVFNDSMKRSPKAQRSADTGKRSCFTGDTGGGLPAGLGSTEWSGSEPGAMFKVPLQPTSKTEVEQTCKTRSGIHRKRRLSSLVGTDFGGGPLRETDLKKVLKPDQTRCEMEACSIASSLSKLEFDLDSLLDSEELLRSGRKMGDIIGTTAAQDSMDPEVLSSCPWRFGTRMIVRPDGNLGTTPKLYLGCKRDQKKNCQPESVSQLHFLSDCGFGFDLGDAYDRKPHSMVDVLTACSSEHVVPNSRFDMVLNRMLDQDSRAHPTLSATPDTKDTQLLEPKDCQFTSDTDGESWPLLTYLPQLYHFSHLHGYTRLARACLTVLLWPQDATLRPPTYLAASCLLRSAEQEHCVEALKRDLFVLTAQILK